MDTIPRPAGDSPRSGSCRRPFAIARVASIFVLIAACPSAPARAQQPAGAEATAKAKQPPAARDKDDDGVQAEVQGEDDKKFRALRAQLAEEAKEFVRAYCLAEIRFIRTASGASEEQARRMARAAREPMRAAVAELVDEQIEQMKQDKEPTSAQVNAALASIRKAMNEVAKSQLAPEQRARYEDRFAKRAEHRKRVTIRNLLVELEHDLRLTADQRDKLGESLATHWDPIWEEAGSFFEGDRMFPELPDPVILPFLTGTQKTAWNKLQKGFPEMTLADEIAVLTAAKDPLADELDPVKVPGAAPER